MALQFSRSSRAQPSAAGGYEFPRQPGSKVRGCTAGKLSEDSLIDSNLFGGFAAVATDGHALALVLHALLTRLCALDLFY